MADGHVFNNILLGGRGGTNTGQLTVHSSGIRWKKVGGQGESRVLNLEKSNILAVSWMKIPRTFEVSVKAKDGLYYKFTGFREQEVNNLVNFIQSSTGITAEEKQLSISGRNWGEVDLSGTLLTFLVGSKHAFEVSLADVAQTQLQGKNDVSLEFHVDDTRGANEKDSLMEISFHVPNSNTQFVGDENHPPAQVFRDKIMSMADVGLSGEDAVALFESIQILTPRGRYTVELHLSFLRLQGQANDFKIQYTSIIRLFVLPKNQSHTFVIVTLDPPIRKGQTMYPHIVLQFDTDFVIETTLAMSEDLLNSKYKDKLEASYKGLIHEVFIGILRGLSGSKVTRPGKFRSCLDGYAVKSSLKAEDGVLYPLEKGFFFLPKPPTLILHDEIEFIEFERHGTGASSSQYHYFDLLVKLKNDQEHVFRNIQRNEYHNLFDFISGKGLKIMYLGETQTTQGGTSVLAAADDGVPDNYLEQIKEGRGGSDSDEEDEDFIADKDDGGSPTDDSGEEESDASESKEFKDKPTKKESKKEGAASKPATKKKSKDEDEEGSKKRKQKKKKDPNAPKRAMSGFMFFSQTERDPLKKDNPGLSFTDVGRALGEKWKKMSAEEREPFERRAREDQKRYKEEMAGYKNAPANRDSGNESDSA
ncbi:hypothetical protein H6P81_009093 [Aristolochia fimbriata]|uniref:FACT complex subunit SSRP1 n=1 Tax=Aristolochia fimbriata TaxID=158543 RepID=A0AAV7EK28_ARIFI|nr:hypothetical protein H6P81_009093 [Aristolochia fimbriata]